MKFKIIDDDEDNKVLVVKDDKGSSSLINQIMEQHVAHLLTKALNKEEKKDDGPKKRTFTKIEATCWTIMLCAAAPWIGLHMLHAYASLMGGYAVIIPTLVK